MFTDYYAYGFGLTVGMEYPVSPNWAFIGSVGYKRFGPAEGMIRDWWDDEGEWPGSTNIEVSEGTLQAVTISVLSKGSLKGEYSRTFPYVKGGFGLTIGGADEIRVDFDQFGGSQTEWQGGTDSDANFSVQIGLGLEHKLGSGNSSVFADIGVAVVFIEDFENPTVVPLNVGFKF